MAQQNDLSSQNFGRGVWHTPSLRRVYGIRPACGGFMAYAQPAAGLWHTPNLRRVYAINPYQLRG
ncbi:MAG: hypothetical protein WCS37_01580 [Chloroflexota bacterium]